MASVEQRVSYIEGKIDSLATKEDLAQLEVKLIKWMLALMVGSITLAASIALFIERLID